MIVKLEVTPAQLDILMEGMKAYLEIIADNEADERDERDVYELLERQRDLL